MSGTEQSLPVCNALWVGASLGRLEAACLGSFVAAGHRVILHVYDPPSGVPAGIVLADAERVVSRDRLIRHRRFGSVALFANRVRYALLKANLGLWIDCDLLCLRAVADAPYIFGRQDESTVNCAVLKIPPEDPLLNDLLAIFTEPHWIPPWASRGKRLSYDIRYRLQPRFGVADMTWGTAGPLALTYYLGQRGMLDLASSPEIFYPIACDEMELLLGADATAMRTRIAPRTACIHLWNKLMAESGAAKPGSFVDKVLDGSWRSFLDAR